MYQPGLGGVRESPVHPGDYCGPCSLCKKDNNYGYLHLGSKSYQLEFFEFVKSKHKISEKDCICKSCQQQHDKKVECVSPREYVSLIFKQAVSGTLDIDIPAINKLALTELIKVVCTELMQDKVLLLSEMVDKFQKFGGCFSSNLRQNQTRFLLDKLQLIFSSNIDTDKVDKIGTMVKLHGVEDRRCLVLVLQGHKKEKLSYTKSEVVSCQSELENDNTLEKACEILKQIIKDYMKN
ncbi:unnamed protein product [Mytilus edulis]|uniref:Uncharacterized protein n=1 Tax=Mytilus edulis TaxID=6550 RepID=A0A8S3ULL7_MYTED|nr:unnamed protein product [Mytilus edulis]